MSRAADNIAGRDKEFGDNRRAVWSAGTAVSTWMLIVGASALGGAIIVWHAISCSKHASEIMLRQYSQMLAAARAEKAKKLAAATGDDEDGKPQEVR